ncbi:MAG TPA: ABC transporter permease subunit [Candidatus Dormibacteraeota bacterium]|nr:ABC transporter permease subunit [Candidatus Dormibacteraeota bacterium]
MTVMLRKALWDIRWTTFWFAAGGAGYVLLIAVFYPTVRQQSEQFANLIATYPKGFLTALGYTNITTFSGFLGGEALNLFWPIIIGVFATLGGAAMVAREVEDGTSEIWLSVPATRWRLLLGKFAALAIGLAICVAACVGTVGVSAAAENVTVSASGLAAMSAVMLVFLFIIAAYSALLSSLVSTRAMAAGISFGITLGFYALWLIGGLVDQMRQLKHFSIFSAYTPQKALETGSVDVVALAIVVGITIACAVAALLVFDRRDAI